MPTLATQLGVVNIYCVPRTKGYRMDRKVVSVLKKLPGWWERWTEADGGEIVDLRCRGPRVHPARASSQAAAGLSRRHRLGAPRLALPPASLSSWADFFWAGEPSVCTELQGKGGGAGIVQTDWTRLFR